MTLDDCNALCAALPATTHVVQWGGADVWKVGGKVFAIASDTDGFAVSVKVSDMAWEILRDAPDCIPAPYLASRGMKWIQFHAPFDEAELRAYIEQSHALVASGLSRKLRGELGLLSSAAESS